MQSAFDQKQGEGCLEGTMKPVQPPLRHPPPPADTKQPQGK